MKTVTTTETRAATIPPRLNMPEQSTADKAAVKSMLIYDGTAKQETGSEKITPEKLKLLAAALNGITPDVYQARARILAKCAAAVTVIECQGTVSPKTCQIIYDMYWTGDKIGAELRQQLAAVWESARCSNKELVMLALKLISKQDPATLED